MKTPELLVEKLRLGELSPAQAAAVRARLAAEGRTPEVTAERLAAPPEELRQRFVRERERIARARRLENRGWSLAVLAASLAVMALVIAMPGEGLRMKGGAALTLYRQTAQGYQRLADGARAQAGDVVQIGLSGGPEAQALVLSLDGNGLTTWHFGPARLEQRGELRLPEAFVLDDAPRFERFFLVLGDALDEGEVRLAIEALKRRDARNDALLVPGARVESLTLDKGPGP